LTSPELLRSVAEGLFDRGSSQALAAALGINRRTVLRWLNGQNAVPLEVWRELAGMLGLRASEVSELRREVEEMIAACAATGEHREEE
jgi:plasmid maintenance system antidote protein VapI